MALAGSASSASSSGNRDAAGFSRFAWAVFAYNVFVVLWGAYVRATGSGAGCGSHWPLCNGEVVPRSPGAETVIEFVHRVTSGLALGAVGGLLIWSMRRFPRGHKSRTYAKLSLVFILIEAALGAGLVLLDYVDQNASLGRAVYLSMHLVNTQILLAVIAMSAWYSTHPAPVLKTGWKLKGMLPMALLVGVSGAVAALGDTLFPATSLADGVRQEISSASHILLRLRVFHPLIALFAVAYILFATMPLVRHNSRTGWTLWAFATVQMIAGAINVLLLAPIWMQLTHLLLANILWLLIVLAIAEGGQGRSDEPALFERGR